MFFIFYFCTITTLQNSFKWDLNWEHKYYIRSFRQRILIELVLYAMHEFSFKFWRYNTVGWQNTRTASEESSYARCHKQAEYEVSQLVASTVDKNKAWEGKTEGRELWGGNGSEFCIRLGQISYQNSGHLFLHNLNRVITLCNFWSPHEQKRSPYFNLYFPDNLVGLYTFPNIYWLSLLPFL